MLQKAIIVWDHCRGQVVHVVVLIQEPGYVDRRDREPGHVRHVDGNLAAAGVRAAVAPARTQDMAVAGILVAAACCAQPAAAGAGGAQLDGHAQQAVAPDLERVGQSLENAPGAVTLLDCDAQRHVRVLDLVHHEVGTRVVVGPQAPRHLFDQALECRGNTAGADVAQRDTSLHIRFHFLQKIVCCHALRPAICEKDSAALSWVLPS